MPGGGSKKKKDPHQTKKSPKLKDGVDWTPLAQHLQSPAKKQMYLHHQEMVEQRKTSKNFNRFHKTENWSDLWFWMTKHGVWFDLQATKFFNYRHPAMLTEPPLCFNDCELVSGIWHLLHTQGRGSVDCPGYVTSTMKLCKCPLWDKPYRDFAKKWMKNHSIPLPSNRHDECAFWEAWFKFHENHRNCCALTFDPTVAWRIAPSCICPKK